MEIQRVTVQNEFGFSDRRLVRYKKLQTAHISFFIAASDCVGSGGTYTYTTLMRGLECSGSKTPPLTGWHLAAARASLGDPR